MYILVYVCHMNYECCKRNTIYIYISYIIVLPGFRTIILCVLPPNFIQTVFLQLTVI